MKTFLVTGGNGYIGSHMSQWLSQQGFDVVILDDHSTSPENEVHNYGIFYRGDISDEKLVSDILRTHKIDGVFHFAAKAIVVESEEKPFDYFFHNVTKSTNFFKVLVDNSIKNIVFSSTCSTYGVESLDGLLSEDNEQNPTNAYAVSKKLVEDVLVYLSHKYKINVALLRYFNVAGSSPKLDIGENHDPETHLIPSLCLSHIKGESMKFKLYGDQYPTEDGTCVRDYIHVCDLARAHELAFNFINKEKGLHVFNLGSGKGYSVKEVLQSFEKITGQELGYEICPPRENDPPRLVCDITKAAKLLGFSPKYNLDDCIEHSLGYLKSKG